MARLTPELVEAMLHQQNAEFETDFDTTNRLLASVICGTGEAELIVAGEQLIASDDARRRILGIRLMRELKQLAERAAEDLADLLQYEQDEGVVNWIVGAFGFLKSDLIASQLISLATHQNPGIRFDVATALANCAADEIPAQSVATLIELSGDIEPDVRFSAIFELGVWWQATHNAHVEPALRRAVHHDSDPAVARAARDALESGDEHGLV